MTTALNPSNRPTVVLRADAALLTGQADGSPLSGTGFGGFAPDGSHVAPTFHAAGIGGQPSLGFDGATQRIALAHGVNAALDAAMAAGASWTIQVVYQIPAPATGIETLFGQAGGGAGPWITTASNNQIVVQDGTGGNGGSRFRGPAGNVPAIIQISFDAPSGITTYGNCDGSTFSYHQAQSGGSTAYSFGLAENGGYGFTGQIRAVVVDSCCLTPSQLADDQAYWRGIFAPSVAAVPCDGDSRTRGTDTSTSPGVSGNTSPFPYPLQLQGLLGSGFDVTNNGNPGIATAGIAYPSGVILTQTTSVLNPLRHKIAAVPVLLSVNDWIGGTVTAAQAAANVASGVLFLQQQSPIPIGFLLMTELDSGYQNHEASWLTYRSAYVTNLKVLLPPTPGVYEYLDTASDPHIGVAGSYANAAYYSPDALHLVGEDSSGNEGGGYGYLAALVEPALQALIAHMVSMLAGPGQSSDPGSANVRLGVTYEINGSSVAGTCHVPTASQTIAGVPVDATVGNVVLPDIGQVAASFAFGPNSSLVGILAGSGSGSSLTDASVVADVATALVGLTAAVNSIGATVSANLDAKVSSRSTYAGGAVASVTAPVTLPATPPAGYGGSSGSGSAFSLDAGTVLAAPGPQRLVINVYGLTLPAGNAVGMTLVYQSGATSGSEPTNGRIGGIVQGHSVTGSGSGRYDTLTLDATTVPATLVAPVPGEAIVLLPTSINPG